MNNSIEQARVFGRVLRLIIGVLLLYSVTPIYQSAGSAFLTATAITIALILVFYTALHFVVSRYFSGINKWFGALIAVTPVVLVYLFVDPAGATSVEIYVGASLLVMAVRGDGGCEVMAFPALLIGEFTHLVCIAFSPIDWVEERIAMRMQSP